MSKTLLLFLPEMYYVIRDLKKKKTKQLTKTVKTTLQRNTQQQTYHRPKRRRRTGRLTRTGLTGYRFHVFHELFKYLKGIRKGKSVNWPTERASNQNISNRRSFGYPFLIYIFSYFETEVVGKSARNNPVRYCGWF